MKMHKIISKTLIATLMLALTPALSACDSGNNDDVAKPTQDTPKAESGEKEEAKPVDPAAQKEAEEVLAADGSGLDPKVAKAVSIAREIEADPSKAEDVLTKHELDREGLDALMYEIARSPELAKSYAAARMNS